MTRMPTKEEFFKRAGEIFEEALEGIWDLAVERDEVADFDVRVREGMGEFARRLLGSALSARGCKERHGPTVECSCGGTSRFKQNRRYLIGTVLPGKTVEVEAAYYVCESCRKGVTPLLLELRTDGDGASVGLQELTVLAGTVEPFREAAGNLLRKFAGVDASGTRVRTRSLEEGEAVEEYLKNETGSVVELGPDEKLCVEIDGGMINSECRWQETKLCVMSGEDGRVETSKDRGMLLRRDIAAVRGGPGKLAEAMESRLSGFDLSRREALVLGDGAPWIWNIAEDMFPNRVEILDYYHAVEHLWKCAAALFGENSEEGREWVEKQEKLFMNDEVGAVIDSLDGMTARCRGPSKRKAIGELRTYLANNAHRMSYKTFSLAGYPIGSGSVESAVKHVIQSRMKRPGTRWRNRGADAIIALRSLWRSTGRWDAYWNTKYPSKLAA